MKVSCPSCNATLNVDDKKLPAGGARIRCPTCQNVFPVKPGAASGAVPLPGSSGHSAVPLPGGSGLPPAVPLPGISAPRAQAQNWESETTRAVPMGALPPAAIPGATSGAAPPSNVPAPRPPGITAVMPQHQRPDQVTQIAAPLGGPSAPTSTVPLPGGSTKPPPPLPRTTRAPAYQPPPEAFPPRGPGSTVPLPGGSAKETFIGDGDGFSAGATSMMAPLGDDVPLPGAASAQPTVIGQHAGIPLPGGPSAQPTVIGPRASFDTGVPLPGSARAASQPTQLVDRGSFERAAGVPLPGAAARSSPSSHGSFASSPTAAETFELPPPGDFDFNAPEPAQQAPASFDFEAPPMPDAPSVAPPSFEAPSFEAPPAPGGFELSQPEAADGAPPSFDFAPPPQTAPDFEAPPPAPTVKHGGDEELALDFNQPPPAAPAAPPVSSGVSGFGEVDLGGDLEFDPSSAQKKPDDLEADLSAPLPSAKAPAGPADGLEMLSFIDDTAKDAGAKQEATAVRRFHIKRRSGKTFGPFEEAVVVKMLEDGQLLGNEETSTDGENWQPIGTEPAFQAVIARLMEAPSRSATQQGMQQVDDKPKGPSMERLKQLYEGRMAAVAVVQSKEPVPFKKRVPYIVAGVLALAFIGTGIGLGVATPYGFFGLKSLLPAKVRSGSREAEYLSSARKGFLTDTWKSYKAAKDSAAQALQAKEYPEARAIWAQAVFYLKRHYNGADPADLARASEEIPNVKLLGEKHPEVLKTEAGEALTQRNADGALAFVAEALARQENQGDLELFFLRAEGYLLKKQAAQAKAEYEQILKKDPKSVRALHALGLLHKSQNEPDEALKSFDEALKIDPSHLSSAVEAAEIELITHKDRAKGLAYTTRALGDEKEGTLSPSEIGKALALKAEGFVVENKLTEAVPVFEQALKADPNNAFAKARLGHAYAELHQPDKALPLFQAASSLVPDNLDYTEGHLGALIALGKMDDAVKVVQAANTRFPGNAMLAYLTGRVQDALDKPKDAEEAYRRAIAADPQNADAYLYLARLFMKFRRFGDARPVLEQGIEKDPKNAALRVGLGELAFHERDLPKAEKEFKTAVELDPVSAEAYLGQSKVALEEQKFDLAAAKVDKALELNPRVAGGWLQKGTALWKLNKLDDAISELERAREEDPRNIQLIVTLGAVEFEKGDLDAALKFLQSALVKEPSQPDGNFYLARVKNVRAEHTQAIDAMKKAIDFNGKNPVYRYWMGRLYLDAKKTAEAMEEWKLALEIDPKYVDALEAMGRLHLDQANPTDLKKAIELFEKALEIDPGRSTVRAAIGDTQMKLENWDGAIASYTKALERDPENKELAIANFRLGQAYQEKKKWDKAIEWYRKATVADEHNADAWLNLGYIYKGVKKTHEAATCFKKYLEIRPDDEHKKEVEEELFFLKGG